MALCTQYHGTKLGLPIQLLSPTIKGGLGGTLQDYSWSPDVYDALESND